MTSITIDSRERHLLAKFSDNNLIIIKTLDVGDILIETTDFKYMFERKTLADFASSIIDGRHSEQRARIMAYITNIGNVRVFYIIEGFDYSNLRSSSEKAVRGAITKAHVRGHFGIVQTADIDDTKRFILGFAEAIEKVKDDLSSNCSTGSVLTTYQKEVQTTQVKKSENINEVSIMLQMLLSVPNIGTTRAREIIEHYGAKTTSELLVALSSGENLPKSVPAKVMERLIELVGCKK